jgi:hypothetical protein
MRLVRISIAAFGFLLMLSAPTRADSELNRLCEIAADNVGDCACATEFLSTHLSANDGRTMMELWGQGSSDPRRLSGSDIDNKYGAQANRVAWAFVRQMNDFRAACPAATLMFEDADLVRPRGDMTRAQLTERPGAR